MNKKIFLLSGLVCFVFLVAIFFSFVMSGNKSKEILQNSLWYSSSKFSMSYPDNYRIDESPLSVTFSKPSEDTASQGSTITINRFGSSSTPDSTIKNLKKTDSKEVVSSFSHNEESVIVITDESQDVHFKSYYVRGDQYLWNITFSYRSGDEIADASEMLVKTFVPNDASLPQPDAEAGN